MIAHEVQKRAGGGSFGGLLRYLTSSQGKTERVGAIELANLVSENAADAVLEVENTQAKNHRAQSTTFHLLASFREAEVSPEVLSAVEARLCAALGFAEHERVSVVHHDTDHVHLHVAINKVHPRNHRCLSPSYSKLVLDREAVLIERDLGLVADNHQYLQREDAVEAEAALRVSARQDASVALSSAQSWVQLHEIAAAHGLVVRRRGNGLVAVDAAGTAVKLSSLGRRLGKGALEKRLGLFEEGAWVDIPASAAQPRPSTIDTGPSTPAASRTMEQAGDAQSLLGWVKDHAAESLRAADSWASLHAACATHGLSLRPRGNGVVLVDGQGRRLKGSSVSRDLGKASLEKRFGPFESNHGPPRDTQTQAYDRKPMKPGASSLYRVYQQQQQRHRQAQAMDKAQLVAQRAHRLARAKRNAKWRWAAVRLMGTSTFSRKLWAHYARSASKREYARVQLRHSQALSQARQAHPLVSWVPWLQQRAAGRDVDALLLLRKRQQGQSAVTTAVSGRRDAGPVILPGVDSVTPAGSVLYRVAGGSVRDDGAKMHLSGGAAEGAMVELLQLATRRYGEVLGVDGDAMFRARIVAAATKSGAAVTFADPALETQRRVMKMEVDSGTAGRPNRSGGTESRGAVGDDREARRQGRSGRPGRGRAGGPGDGASERARESDAASPQQRRAPRPFASLRRLSEVDVAFRKPRSEVLLPGDARRDVGQRRSATDHGVRRRDGGGVKKGRGPRR